MAGRVVRGMKKVRQSDPAKEQSLKALGAILSRAGYVVRREKLKSGPGWRAVSGSCHRASAAGGTESITFVDRAMPQDDQIEFLVGRIRELALAVSAEDVQELPETLRLQLGVRPPIEEGPENEPQAPAAA